MDYFKAAEVTREYVPWFSGQAERREDTTEAGHLEWMLDQVGAFEMEGRLEKASRWLGFVQGVLVARGRMTTEDAKRANMPAEATFDGERI